VVPRDDAEEVCMTSRVVSWGLACLGVLFVVACSDEGGSGDDGGAGGSSDPSSETRVCFYEYRVSYSCSDGDGDPGEWEGTCSDIGEDACYNHPDFDGSSESIDGCIFRTEFRGNEMLAPTACETRLGGSGASSTGATGGGGSGGGSSSSASAGGGDAASEGLAHRAATAT
jgi:hypothetical protein